MFKDNHRTMTWPILPLPGASVTALLLLLLCFFGARISALSLLLAAIGGVLLAGILLLHRTLFSFLVPLFCVSAVLFTASNPFSAAVALLFLPIGYSIAFSVYRGFSRIKSVVFIGTVTALTAFLLLICIFFIHSISPAAFFSSLRETVLSYLTAPTIIGQDGTETPLLTRESASLLLRHAALLLPAFFLCMLFWIAYLTTALLRKILLFLDAGKELLPNEWHLLPGRAHAAIYMASNLITFLCASANGGEVFYYAFYNVTLVFLLPLAVFGLNTLLPSVRNAQRFGTLNRIALTAFACMIACAGLYWLMTALAFYGVYIIFRPKNASVSNDSNPSL